LKEIFLEYDLFYRLPVPQVLIAFGQEDAFIEQKVGAGEGEFVGLNHQKFTVYQRK
jgi:hypothetical protein